MIANYFYVRWMRRKWWRIEKKWRERGREKENRSKIRYEFHQRISSVRVTFGGLVNCPIGSLAGRFARSLASELPSEFVDSQFQHVAWPWPHQTTHEVTNTEAIRRRRRRRRLSSSIIIIIISTHLTHQNKLMFFVISYPLYALLLFHFSIYYIFNQF